MKNKFADSRLAVTTTASKNKNRFTSVMLVFLTLLIFNFSLSGCSLTDFLQSLSEQMTPIEESTPDVIFPSSTSPDVSKEPTEKPIEEPEQQAPQSKQSGDATKSTDDIIAEIAKSGHSDYGYNCLDDYEKVVYNDLLDALLTFKKEITTKNIDSKALAKVILYMGADYPLVDWMGPRYSYQKQLTGDLKIFITFDSDKATVKKELEAIAIATDKICENISSELPDFDKAVLIHDAIISLVEYNLKAPRSTRVAGALLDNSATCIGYSKTFQYMLCANGIDSLMVYGNANEPHAWNMVKLDGNFYVADPTWDDPQNKTLNYVSHDYIFLSDKQISASHTVTNSRNYPLPICEKEDMAFVKKKGLIVDNSDINEIIAVFSKAVDCALALESPAITIGFSDDALFKSIVNNLSTGELDSVLAEICNQRGLGTLTGRTVNEDLRYLTYFREIK